MAENRNPDDDRVFGNMSQGGQTASERKMRQGGIPDQSTADDRPSGRASEETEEEMPNRDTNKSTNGEEFDREGRNPKPFSVG